MPSFPIGRLNFDAEPGTLLGPDSTGQFMVVAARDDNGVTVSYATVPDIEQAAAAAHVDGPRSMTEVLLARNAWNTARLR